jgi:transposase InsO family protein
LREKLRTRSIAFVIIIVESILAQFMPIFKEQGISHHFNSPNTPQLNALAEWMNTTILERVRCLLSSAKLPKHYWGEALLNVV